jgi:hypothetical protein
MRVDAREVRSVHVSNHDVWHGHDVIATTRRCERLVPAVATGSRRRCRHAAWWSMRLRCSSGCVGAPMAVSDDEVVVYRVSIHDTVRRVRASDLVVVLGLLRPGRAETWSVRSLASELRMPSAAVQRSLVRLADTPVYNANRRRMVRSVASGSLLEAVPFIAPAQLGAPSRGVPTAWGAAPLSEEFRANGELVPVWPDPRGEVRGLALAPVHSAALDAARCDCWLYEMLALFDGIRVGDARVRGVALAIVRARLAEGDGA